MVRQPTFPSAPGDEEILSQPLLVKLISRRTGEIDQQLRKSAYYSYRGLGSSSQFPQDASELPITPVTGIHRPLVASAGSCTHMVHINLHRHMHIYIKIINIYDRSDGTCL